MALPELLDHGRSAAVWHLSSAQGSEDRRPSAQCPVLGNSGQASFHPVLALDTKPRTGIDAIISMLNKTYISSMATF